MNKKIFFHSDICSLWIDTEEYSFLLFFILIFFICIPNMKWKNLSRNMISKKNNFCYIWYFLIKSPDLTCIHHGGTFKIRFLGFMCPYPYKYIHTLLSILEFVLNESSIAKCVKICHICIFGFRLEYIFIIREW